MGKLFLYQTTSSTLSSGKLEPTSHFIWAELLTSTRKISPSENGAKREISWEGVGESSQVWLVVSWLKMEVNLAANWFSSSCGNNFSESVQQMHTRKANKIHSMRFCYVVARILIKLFVPDSRKIFHIRWQPFNFPLINVAALWLTKQAPSPLIVISQKLTKAPSTSAPFV